MIGKLFLVRHGESEYNKLGLWTGHTDVSLADAGYEEARKAGEVLKNERIDVAYVSDLKRTQETFDEIKKVCGKDDLLCQAVTALKERDYGVHTGKNKWQVKEEIGDEEFQRIRRGWDVKVEGGETLKDVHDRVVPYYKEAILKDLQAGKNVLVVSHGNTLRALIKYLEDVDDAKICDVEMATGEVHCCTIDEDGKSTCREILKIG
jgi:2,3-bisphosphoglycerate-dependent phosphoglycerate mutase